tara:strand:- start:702 stop:1499 length:798 start_codon:yes stop_codon:yes gene_type:complete
VINTKRSKRKDSFLFVLFILSFITIYAQRNLKEGRVLGKEGADNIRIANKNSALFTLSDSNGNFSIPLKIGDTIIFSALQYEEKFIAVNKQILQDEDWQVVLQIKNNELEEVLLVPLSGKLALDLRKVDLQKPISAASQNIPAFTGIPLEIIPTIYEIYTITPFGISIDVEAAFKLHSGYYKKLKKKREIESQDLLVDEVLDFFSQEFFKKEYSIHPSKIKDFIIYCIEKSDLKNSFSAENYNLVLNDFQLMSTMYNQRTVSKVD